MLLVPSCAQGRHEAAEPSGLKTGEKVGRGHFAYRMAGTHSQTIHGEQFSSMFKRFYLNILSFHSLIILYKFICKKTTNVRSHRCKMTYAHV